MLLTIDRAREYLRIGHTNEDNLLLLLMDSVEGWAKKFCGIAIPSTVFTETLNGGGFALWPHNHPVSTVASIEHALTGSQWTAHRVIQQMRVMRTDTLRWPAGPWTVTYTAGYDVDDIPEGFRMVSLMLLRRAWDNRGGAASEGVAGWNVDWESLLNSDIRFLMQPFDFNIRAG